MSKYTDIATGRAGSTLPVVRKPAVKFPTANKNINPMQTPEMKQYLQEGYDAIDERTREQIRNPISYKLMTKGSQLTNKVLGKGWASDMLGSLPGGILRTLERPTRFLMGSGYGVARGVQGLMGNKEAASDFQNNVNPFMTPEDSAALKTDKPTVPLKYGTKLAADAINWVVGPLKGVGLLPKMLVGGGTAGAGTLAEDKPTLRSAAQNALIGTATAGALHFGSKGISKLRSGKVPGEAPTIEAPSQLPEGVAPKQLPAPVEVPSKTLFHETSPSSIREISSIGNSFELDGKFVSSNMDLARGQGGNTGIVVEIDPSKVTTTPYMGKPGLTAMKNISGDTGEEVITGGFGKYSQVNSKDAVKSIIVKTNAKLTALDRGILKNKWVRGETLSDGSVRFYPKNSGQFPASSIDGGGNKLPPTKTGVTSIVPDEGNNGIVPREPALEGEIVDKSGLVKQDIPGQVKVPPVEGIEAVGKKQILPGETTTVGLKSMLNKFGGPGKRLSTMIDEFENQSHVLSNTSFNRFQQAFKNFQTSTKGTKAPMVGNDGNIVQYILDVYNGKKPLNISPGERAVADSFFKDLTLPASLEAQRFNLKPNGKNIGPARMFLPLIIKDTTRFAKSMTARLLKQGKSAQEAAEIIEHMMKGTAPKAKTPLFAGFEKARKFNPTTLEELAQFGYETDLNKIAATWSKGAWRRIAAMRVFGGLDGAGEHTGLAKELQNLIKGGVFSEGEMGGDVGTLKRGIMTAINGAPAENEITKNIGKLARAYSAWKIGPGVALQQPSTLGSVAGIAGEGNTIKAIVNNIASKIGTKKIPTADKMVVDNAAVALGGGLDDVLRSEYGAGGSTIMNAIEKVTGWKLKSSGTPAFDSAIRRVSAYASLDWVRQSVKKLSSGKLTPKAQAALYDEINRFAVPVKEELDDIIARGGEMTPFETSKAIYQFGKKTQYGLSRAELPATWSGSTLGRVATQLKSFGYEQTQLWARLYSHGKQTGNFSPLIKSIIYTVGINALSSRAINLLLKSPEQRKKETAGTAVLDILGQTLIGPVYSAMRYSGSGAEMLGSAIAGPSIGDASQLIYQGGAAAVQEGKNIFSPSYKKKHTALRSFAKSVYKKVPPFSIVSQTPVIGPYVNEKLFPTSGTKQFNK